MKTLVHILAVSCLAFWLFLSAGCASITTWEATGIEIYHIKKVEVRKMADGNIQLVQKGTLTKQYIPYLSLFANVSEEERAYHYSCKDIDMNSLFYTFQLKADGRQPVVLREKKNLLFLDGKNLSPLKHTVNELNPADLSLMKENPFIAGNLAAGGKQ